MSDTSFDLVVIGGGPGGYVAAIRAAQLGFSVACVEKRDALGGTCLNVGCIPSKALLQSSHHFETAATEFSGHGITTDYLGFDLSIMMERKKKIVADLTSGVAFLFKKNKIARFNGCARLDDGGTIVVQNADNTSDTLKAKHIILATGSEVSPLPGVVIDEEKIVSSTGALSLTGVPGHLIVIGAGVIGLELGSVWRRLGAKVTVVEYLERILPPFDGAVALQMKKILEQQGIEFRLGSKLTGAELQGEGVQLTMESLASGNSETLAADVVLVATGRRPYTEGLNLEGVGIETDKHGFIVVDPWFRTALKDVYAIGDVIGGAMLAHKAEDEGIAVAEIIAGKAGHVNYNAIPSVVYTHPEVAAVGKTEEQLKEEGIAYHVGMFPFSANSRARTLGERNGFVKLLADAGTDRLLGAHIIGPSAGELIAELTLGIEFSAAAEDIACICHAHPGLGEAVREAALAVDGRAIHI